MIMCDSTETCLIVQCLFSNRQSEINNESPYVCVEFSLQFWMCDMELWCAGFANDSVTFSVFTLKVTGVVAKK